MILDKYYKPEMVVLAPPTYMLVCLVEDSRDRDEDDTYVTVCDPLVKGPCVVLVIE